MRKAGHHKGMQDWQMQLCDLKMEQVDQMLQEMRWWEKEQDAHAEAANKGWKGLPGQERGASVQHKALYRRADNCCADCQAHKAAIIQALHCQAHTQTHKGHKAADIQALHCKAHTQTLRSSHT